MNRESAVAIVGRAQTDTEVGVVNKSATAIEAAFKELMPKLASASLKRVPAEFIVSTAMTVLRGDSKLRECDPLSVVHCVLQSAQTGLRLDPTLQQAALIARWNGNKKRLEAQFMPMYRGLLALVRRSGQIVHVAAQAVYAADMFTYEYGSNQSLVHRPDMSSRNVKELVAFYAYARLREGGFQFEVMTLDEINEFKAEALSEKKNVAASPWTTDFVAMGCKTVLKRLCKLLPIEDANISNVVKMDDLVERNIPQEHEIQEGLAVPTGDYRDDSVDATTVDNGTPKSIATPTAEAVEGRPVGESKETSAGEKWIATASAVIATLKQKNDRKRAKEWYVEGKKRFEAGELTEAQFMFVRAELIRAFPAQPALGTQIGLPLPPVEKKTATRKRADSVASKHAREAEENVAKNGDPLSSDSAKARVEFEASIGQLASLAQAFQLKAKIDKARQGKALIKFDHDKLIAMLDEKFKALKVK